MTLNKTAKYCNFCSEFSQANGEDPIGSAGNHECWLIIEATPPWKINIWLEPDPMPQEVLDVLKLSWERRIKIRQLAIARAAPKASLPTENSHILVTGAYFTFAVHQDYFPS